MDTTTSNVKATRDDWLNAALDTLIAGGIEQVKILTLAERLNVSRSSFYWYFKSRDALLDALLDHWLSTNTKAIVDHAALPAATITKAVCNVFVGFLDPALFNNRLDFAIRDWSRRAPAVREVLHRSDAQRIAALTEMFQRFSYPAADAITRARVLYYMQIGYFDAELDEPIHERMPFTPHYLLAFTGVRAPETEVTALDAKLARIYRLNDPA
ncbi:TetR/AcrR family transcriptional regulator [Sulfitobacter sp. SK012]|uniref:TetR/AcrR family transcriptional regulator n=1 Tax=Sulfitobacter sp. SK012 TaxID=1389005 RepID=UPI000E09E47B|nr:TetR/AcrR family transcriptional regulator [Sulfitobacter sp. SK012]AXI44944.1 TetR/AcrR family transcriptional regulator [Sulfitobacter sp. SK012]